MAETVDRRNRPYAPRMAPEDRREQLLDSVLTIIVREGIHKVSMDAVAKEAGVTRPVVYGQFADTNALLRASLDREEKAVLEQLAEILPSPGRGDPDVQALTFVEGFVRAVLAEPNRWRAVLTLVDSSTPTFRRRLERGRRALIGIFEDVLRQSIAKTDPSIDVELLARALYALILDAGRTALSEPGQFPPERISTFARTIIQRFIP